MTSFPLPLVQPPGGRFDGPVHSYAVRAYFEDTDLSGVVYHANYLRWFERARSDMLRLLGIDQRAAQEAGEGAYAVSEANLRYRAPARLDDVVLIASVAEELGAASCRMFQQAFRIDGETRTLLADVRLRVGFVGPDGRPRRQPAAWRAAFATLIPEHASVPEPK
ncbi:MAG: YbgC/FadM family acyl-CoA thioesterase [Sphingomonadales bacterium]|nr:YbgC/FadM family acyl-CoA thioesterase [Sphingomonadales bacterium]